MCGHVDGLPCLCASNAQRTVLGWITGFIEPYFVMADGKKTPPKPELKLS